MSQFEEDLRTHLGGEAERIPAVPRELWLRIVEGDTGFHVNRLAVASAAVAALFILGAVALLAQPRPGPAGGPVEAASPRTSPKPSPPGKPSPAVPAASAFSCGATPAGGTQSAVGNLTALRVAHQNGFDRVTFEFAGAGIPVYQVSQQADAHFKEDASGRDINLQGQRGLKVVFHGAGTADAAGQPTYTGGNDLTLSPGGAIAEVRAVGNFERVLSWGVGLNAARGCLRVTELAAPERLVIDVQDSPPAG